MLSLLWTGVRRLVRTIYLAMHKKGFRIIHNTTTPDMVQNPDTSRWTQVPWLILRVVQQTKSDIGVRHLLVQ